MLSIYDYLINVCLRKIKKNQFASFYIILNGIEYKIIFKNYDCDDETIDFDAIKISKSSDYYPTIYANLDRLMQLV